MSKRFRNRCARARTAISTEPAGVGEAVDPASSQGGRRARVRGALLRRRADLVRHLESFALRCVLSRRHCVRPGRARHPPLFKATVITNTPYSRPILLPLEHFIPDGTERLANPARRVSAHVVYARALPPALLGDCRRWPRRSGSAAAAPKTSAGSVSALATAAGPSSTMAGGGASVAIVCAGCGKPFRPLRSDARTCSDACRQRARRARLTVTEV